MNEWMIVLLGLIAVSFIMPLTYFLIVERKRTHKISSLDDIVLYTAERILNPNRVGLRITAVSRNYFHLEANTDIWSAFSVSPPLGWEGEYFKVRFSTSLTEIILFQEVLEDSGVIFLIETETEDDDLVICTGVPAKAVRMWLYTLMIFMFLSLLFWVISKLITNFI